MGRNKKHISKGSREFGKLLQRIRLAAGYSSLDKSVQVARKLYGANTFSKSLLHLIENGQVTSLRPELLQQLADIYKCSYADLALQWFQLTYEVNPSLGLTTHGFVREISADSLSLEGPEKTVQDRMKIISTKQLEIAESELPRGSEVGVAATRFLDDGIYYPMVSASIAKGVRFYYFLPEVERSTYDSFIHRLESDFPKLKGKIDGFLTHFITRPNLDFPLNYVVTILPSGEIQGYIGLLADRNVQYFQVADPKLSRRLFNGFRWVLVVARDKVIRSRLAELEISLSERTQEKGLLLFRDKK